MSVVVNPIARVLLQNQALLEGGYDADAILYFDRVVAAGGTISITNKGIISDSIKRLKYSYSSNLWTKIKELGLWTITDQTGAVVKVKYVTNANVTINGSPTWGSTTGYVLPSGNTTKYINTNLNMGSYTKQNIAAFTLADNVVGNATDPCLMGFGNAATPLFFLNQWVNSSSKRKSTVGTGSTNCFADLKLSDANAYGTYAGALESGLTRVAYFENYTQHNFVANETGSFPSLNLYIGAFNNNGASASNHAIGDLKGYMVATDCSYQDYADILTEVYSMISYDPASCYASDTHLGLGFRKYNSETTDSEVAYNQVLFGYRGTASSMVPFSVRKLSTYPQSQRDSTVFRHSDGYYYAVTSNYNLMVDFVGHLPSPYLKVSRSTNFINWKEIYTYQPLASDKFVFSPSFFQDTDNKLYITFTESVNQNAVCAQYIVEITSLSATPTFGTPVQITGTGLTTRLIDNCIVKIGSTYYLWAKNEATTYLRWASSSSISSGYDTTSGDITTFGTFVEGSFLKEWTPGTWRIYYEKFSAKTGYFWRDSTNNFASWGAETALTASTTQEYKMRHGEIILKS